MAAFQHSSMLFLHEDGRPIHFYMHPCSEKATLKPLIVHGGGLISSKVQKDSIKLVAEPGTERYSDYILSSYITDCVESNELLDMKKYRANKSPNKRMSRGSQRHSNSSDLDLEDFDEPSDVIRVSSRNRLGRQKYLVSEDMAILKYLYEERCLHDVTGNGIWKTMEKQKVTKHTWQSMRDRYLKVIKRDLRQYHMDRAMLTYFTDEVLNGDAPARSSSLTRKRSMTSQDKASGKKLEGWLSKTVSKAAECEDDPIILDEIDEELLDLANKSQENRKKEEGTTSGGEDGNVSERESSPHRPTRRKLDLVKSPSKPTNSPTRLRSEDSTRMSSPKKSPRKHVQIASQNSGNSPQDSPKHRHESDSLELASDLSLNDTDHLQDRGRPRKKRRLDRDVNTPGQAADLVDENQNEKRGPERSPVEGRETNANISGRKRGRPRKEKTDDISAKVGEISGNESSFNSSNNDVNESLNSEGDTILKSGYRKRGRPRKEKVYDVSIGVSDNTVASPKKRGRPKKTVTGESNVSKDVASENVTSSSNGSVNKRLSGIEDKSESPDTPRKRGRPRNRNVTNSSEARGTNEGNGSGNMRDKSGEDPVDNHNNTVVVVAEVHRSNVEDHTSPEKPGVNSPDTTASKKQTARDVDIAANNNSHLNVNGEVVVHSSQKDERSKVSVRLDGKHNQMGRKDLGLPNAVHLQKRGEMSDGPAAEFYWPKVCLRQVSCAPNDVVSVPGSSEAAVTMVTASESQNMQEDILGDSSVEELEDYMESISKVQSQPSESTPKHHVNRNRPEMSPDLFPEVPCMVTGPQAVIGHLNDLPHRTSHRVVGSMTKLKLSSSEPQQYEVLNPPRESFDIEAPSLVHIKATKTLQNWILNDFPKSPDRSNRKPTSGGATVLLDRRSHITSITNRIKRVCQWLGLDHIELLSIVWACSGSVEHAVHWILHSEVPAGGMFWSAEEDIILESGNPAERKQLESLYGKSQVEARLQFLAENSSS